MSSFTNFDNLLLQTLMGRLQIHPPPPQYPFLSQSLEDLLFNVDDSSDEDDDNTNKTQLSKEESKLEKEIIRVILSGKIDSLKPNSGQAVTIGEHHICVGFHEEQGSDYRVWEWHGHIMLFDEEDGYTPEYIYGNYFERLLGKTAASTTATPKQEQEENEDEEEGGEEKIGNLGLRELIDGGDSGAARILHRIISAGSPRFTMLHILRKKMRISIIFIFLANLNKSLALCHAFRKVYLIPHGRIKTAGLVARNGCHEEIQVGIERGLQLATHRMVILEMIFMTCDLVIVESDLEQLWQVGDISEGNHVVLQ
ncbi:hypothetical protein H0E87_013134 [Populus deltoides]|uniref:Uncharacterized protein n=1 Tax=Populus deltoides TaxID=3696 RepID=A0A8T2YM24_POPDE|nr:hypothetical protein H0E87_013134 [Populus deltoides]